MASSGQWNAGVQQLAVHVHVLKQHEVQLLMLATCCRLSANCACRVRSPHGPPLGLWPVRSKACEGDAAGEALGPQDAGHLKALVLGV